MFERLILDSFGRFVHAELELDRTTLLVGGNESGKTTVFDAIRSCLAQAAAQTDRYGEQASAQLVGNGTLSNDGDLELLHLLPERGATFAADAETTSAIDARLRAGLVALRAVKNQLEAMASSAADSPHNRDLQELRTNLDALAEQRQEVWDRRCQALENATAATRLEAELDALDAQIAHQQERTNLLGAQLDDERERGRLCARRTALLGRLEALADHRADREMLEGLRNVSDAELARLDALQEELSAHLAQIDAIEARQANGRRRLETIAEEIDEARAEQPITKRAAERATATRLRLDRFLAQPKAVERQVWRGGRVVAALAFFAAGMASAALFAGTVHFVGLGLGMMLGTCTLALGRQTIREDDEQAEAAFLAQLCDEWNREPGLPRLEASAPTHVFSFCDENIRAYQALTTTLDQHVTYKTRVEEELAHILDRSHAMLLNTLPPRQEGVEAWMRDNECAGRDEYAERLRQRKAVEARLLARHEAGTVPQDAEQIAALETALKAELDALDHDVQGEPKSDEELDALGALLREAADLGAQLSARRDELTAELDALDVAEMRDLGTVLHQIEQEQMRVEATIAELEEDRRTAAAAAELVASLASSPDLHWDLLNETLATLLAGAGLAKWRVTIDGLRESEVVVVDPRGRVGTLATLGSGSHDLIALACRLALAVELGADALPLLVLEEPFARLDEAHTTAALELLDIFADRTAWQIILIARAAPPPRGIASGARTVDLEHV